MSTINVSTDEVESAITELLQKGDDLTAPMKSIGEEMINRTQQRFRDKEAPDGTPGPITRPSLKSAKATGVCSKAKAMSYPNSSATRLLAIASNGAA
ncbi:phage virion morphogenesis protein [Halomonas sp. QX-1]|uniref:Phage virion morphogenesis protein n=1 Tax=Vreelandella maris TaxID=2729617 RepID=A0A7Y6RFX9_9GAMM|nr:phage virion morphogenesis protein [Halomonas maris]NVF16237.1 phage virion morphogenesis protein [Halomonas maris]|tara:strand:+ start:7302 stop:7592 length:291 start_codon:yes stop_codon:yes gene_type:complete